jgi:hypothetical protein
MLFIKNPSIPMMSSERKIISNPIIKPIPTYTNPRQIDKSFISQYQMQRQTSDYVTVTIYVSYYIY